MIVASRRIAKGVTSAPLLACLAAFSSAFAPMASRAQQATSPTEGAAPSKVEVRPVADDEEIRRRLQDIMEATGWFTRANVMVKDGVVFLSGQAKSEELKRWASNLARNTQGVVAVANRMEANRPSAWNFEAAQVGLAELGHDLIRALPFLVLGLIVVSLSFAASWLAMRGARAFLRRRVRSRLLRGVLA